MTSSRPAHAVQGAIMKKRRGITTRAVALGFAVGVAVAACARGAGSEAEHGHDDGHGHGARRAQPRLEPGLIDDPGNLAAHIGRRTGGWRHLQGRGAEVDGRLPHPAEPGNRRFDAPRAIGAVEPEQIEDEQIRRSVGEPGPVAMRLDLIDQLFAIELSGGERDPGATGGRADLGIEHFFNVDDVLVHGKRPDATVFVPTVGVIGRL